MSMTALLTGVSTAVNATGFALDEHGASGLGTAYAGGVTAADNDASTVWWNPAGMSLLQNQQVAVAGTVIFTNFSVNDRGSSLSPLVGGGPIPGAVGNTDEIGVVPSFYYVRPMNDKIALGLGIDAPFGLAAKYDTDWFGRYQAIDTDSQSFNINPSLSYKVNDNVSLGLGVNAMFFRVNVSSAVDQSAVCLGLEGGGIFPGGTCGSAGLVAPGSFKTDGNADITIDDWGFGFNLGAMFTPTDKTRIGLTYRSGVDMDLTGDAEFIGISPLYRNPMVNLFTNTGASGDLDLPASAAAGVFQRINDRWAIMGDITWAQWSKVSELRIKFDNPNQPDSVETLNYNDNFIYRLGVHYRRNDQWKFRFGAAYEESSVSSSRYATPRVPVSDRTWVALGARYTPSPNLSVDLGYSHLFYDTLDYNRTLETEVPTANSTLVGVTDDGSSDIFGVQVNWRF